MKKLSVILLLLAANLAAQVNGSIENVSNKKVMFLWGTHDERGYAHGYLLGENLKSLMDSYLIEYICQKNVAAYSMLRQVYTNYFEVDERYQVEAESMVKGIKESGVSLVNNVIGREYDVNDFLMMTALPEIEQLIFGLVDVQFGCSSISSWGSVTENDPELNGSLVITRLMDWSNEESLCDNHLLIVNLPSEENEQPWISFGFSGLIGALSAINEAGVAAFMNQGNIAEHDYTHKFNPVLLSIRDGIESADFNGDDICDDQDILNAVQAKVHGGASLIHTVMEKGIDDNPFIIEVNNKLGIVIRGNNDNTLVKGNNLVATNHFRKLYQPEDCSRYSRIIDSLDRSSEMTSARSRNLLGGAAGVTFNLQAIQYVPAKGKVYWATATTESAAFQNEYSEFDISSLFTFITDLKSEEPVSDFLLYQNYPNPFNPISNIKYELANSGLVSLKVYNTLGEEVAVLVEGIQPAGSYKVKFDGSQLTSGVYIYQLRAGQFTTAKKLTLIK